MKMTSNICSTAVSTLLVTTQSSTKVKVQNQEEDDSVCPIAEINTPACRTGPLNMASVETTSKDLDFKVQGSSYPI
jgi:hypothetical protein